MNVWWLLLIIPAAIAITAITTIAIIAYQYIKSIR